MYGNLRSVFGAGLIGLAALFWAVPAQATPDIQHWRTDNGARVYFVPAPDLPIVDVRIVFDAGAARDGDHPGLASLTNRLMVLGAGDLNADAIARRFEDVGARQGNGAQRDMAWLSLRSLSDEQYLQPAAQTLALLLQKPTFPEEDLERERRRRLVALKQREQSPGQLAQEAFYQNVFGDHPYAQLPVGTEAGLKGMTRDDLIAFHGRYYVANNAVVAIVGDLTRKQAGALAEQLVGKLPGGERAPELPPVEPLTRAEDVRIQFPSTQSHVLMGQPGMRRGDKDYFALYVGNHTLGGSGLVSRIFKEVREKRGLSYSAYSYFLPMRRKGPFLVGMQTRNEQSGKGVQVLRQTLKAFIDEGITAEELKASKQNITGGFPLRIDSNSKIVQYIAMIGFYDLPLDYLDRFIERVEAVTREQVNDAFRRRVHPDRMVTVIVGNGAEKTAGNQ